MLLIVEHGCHGLCTDRTRDESRLTRRRRRKSLKKKGTNTKGA